MSEPPCLGIFSSIHKTMHLCIYFICSLPPYIWHSINITRFIISRCSTIFFAKFSYFLRNQNCRNPFCGYDDTKISACWRRYYSPCTCICSEHTVHKSFILDGRPRLWCTIYFSGLTRFLDHAYIIVHDGGMNYAGKVAWPELLGVEIYKAKEIIERENKYVKVIIIRKGWYRTHDYLCHRVFVWTTEISPGAVVIEIPIVG